MQANYLVLFFILLVVNIDLSVSEPKRSGFGFGRSRPKSSSNLSVRRRGHLAETPKAATAPAPKQTHTSHASQPSHTSHAASAPQGPPPAYSAGPSVGKTSLNAAPPAYSSHGAAPPSYSTAMGHGKYPQQAGYSGVNSGSNLNHQSSPSYGWNTNSHHSPYGSSGHYGGGVNHGGFAQPPPSYGGYHPGGFGGMPNSYGGYGGMMGGGMMGGGMMGGMGVQPIYMQQQKPSLLGGVAGYALTGLAGYQLARAIGGGSGYNSHSTQHIYHHYDSPQQNGQMPSISENPQAPSQTPQQTLQTPQTPQTNTQYSPSFPINPDVPSVPLAPFPSDVPAVASPDCKENCTTEANVASTTPVPDAEFAFMNIHPSLFLYAYPVPNKDLEYWAKSVDKKLNLTPPDANNPQSTATTTSP